MEQIIITIGRQYGSGGRVLGKKLAEALDIPFYDKELVELAAKKSDMSKEILREVDEKATSSFLYSLVTGSNTIRGIGTPMYYEMPLNDKLFIAQSDVIKTLAAQGSCVIVGRCADYVLEDTQFNCANVFIYASMADKIARIVKKYDLSPEKAKDKIVKTEKRRRTYYNYYSNMEWGKMDNYDLCLNTSALNEEDAVQVLKQFVLMKQKNVK